MVTDLFVTGAAAINTLSVSESIVLGPDLVISSYESMVDGQLSVVNSIDSINAPLSLQSSGSQPLSIMAGLVNIDTNGNVQIAGDLFVAGKVESSGLTIRQANNSQPTTHNQVLSIKDAQGQPVAGISASGSAEFKELETAKLSLKADTQATSSATVEGGIVFETTATAVVQTCGMTSPLDKATPPTNHLTLVSA